MQLVHCGNPFSPKTPAQVLAVKRHIDQLKNVQKQPEIMEDGALQLTVSHRSQLQSDSLAGRTY